MLIIQQGLNTSVEGNSLSHELFIWWSIVKRMHKCNISAYFQVVHFMTGLTLFPFQEFKNGCSRQYPLSIFSKFYYFKNGAKFLKFVKEK